MRNKRSSAAAKKHTTSRQIVAPNDDGTVAQQHDDDEAPAVQSRVATTTTGPRDDVGLMILPAWHWRRPRRSSPPPLPPTDGKSTRRSRLTTIPGSLPSQRRPSSPWRCRRTWSGSSRRRRRRPRLPSTTTRRTTEAPPPRSRSPRTSFSCPTSPRGKTRNGSGSTSPLRGIPLLLLLLLVAATDSNNRPRRESGAFRVCARYTRSTSCGTSRRWLSSPPLSSAGAESLVFAATFFRGNTIVNSAGSGRFRSRQSLCTRSSSSTG